MKNVEFVKKAVDISNGENTIYAKGFLGAEISKVSVEAKKKQYPEWYTAKKIKTRFQPLYGKGYFGFDCICLIKAILWGWDDGIITYKKDGIPDFTVNQMIETHCEEVSEDFSEIQPGEVLWIPGHTGIYLGDGLAAECTTSWEGNVQITACNCEKDGYNRRDWKKHGKLNFLTYEEAKKTEISSSRQILKKGAKGGDVSLLQFLLVQSGKDIEIDGSFGKKTEDTLKEWQEEHGLEPDGSCGKKTWKELLKGNF